MKIVVIWGRPPVLMQPIAANDVAAALATIAVAEPLNDTVEVAGPEPIRMHELVRRFLAGNRDEHEVIADPQAGCFGIPVKDHSLTPGGQPRIGPTRIADWLSRSIHHLIPTRPWPSVATVR